MRAGHLRGGINHRIERETYPGHELMLCIRGKGWVRVAGRKHDVSAAQLVWVNCHHAHAYGAVTDDPWELYWLRAEGRSLDRIAQMLQCERSLLWTNQYNDEALLRANFRSPSTKPGDTASCDAAVAEIIAIAFESRPSLLDSAAPELPPAVVKAAGADASLLPQTHTRGRAGIDGWHGQSHFSRMFKAAMGTSPSTGSAASAHRSG